MTKEQTSFGITLASDKRVIVINWINMISISD